MTKTALITGATAGFGAAAVRRFAGAGWRVIATGRRVDRLKKLVEEFGTDKVFPLAFDMRKPAAIDAALATLPESFRNIDLLINNAGLALGTAPAQKADLDQWNQMIETNVTGLVTITHKLLATLIAQKGAIINISSVAASYPYPGGNVYGGTKAFVAQFSLGLRSDLHGTGVRVTSVDAYLPPDSRSSNLVIRGHSTVDRVVLDRGRATGIQLVDGTRDPRGLDRRGGGNVRQPGDPHAFGHWAGRAPR